MAGLDPAIHVDPRVKPGDDGFRVNELIGLGLGQRAGRFQVGCRAAPVIYRAMITGILASMMMWRVAPPKIIWRMRLRV